MKESERSDGRGVFIVETIRIPLIILREAEDARPDGCEVRRLKGIHQTSCGYPAVQRKMGRRNYQTKVTNQPSSNIPPKYEPSKEET